MVIFNVNVKKATINRPTHELWLTNETSPWRGSHALCFELRLRSVSISISMLLREKKSTPWCCSSGFMWAFSLSLSSVSFCYLNVTNEFSMLLRGNESILDWAVGTHCSSLNCKRCNLLPLTFTRISLTVFKHKITQNCTPTH